MRKFGAFLGVIWFLLGLIIINGCAITREQRQQKRIEQEIVKAIADGIQRSENCTSICVRIREYVASSVRRTK